MCIRVLITDDQPRARRSLAALLIAMRLSALNDTENPVRDRANRAPFPVEIVGEAENGQQAIEQVQALRPNVIVMDLLRLHTVSSTEPGLDGLAAIRMIKNDWPAIRIVVLTMYATDRTSVLAAGADAFLLKGCPTSELLEAVMPDLQLSQRRATVSIRRPAGDVFEPAAA